MRTKPDLDYIAFTDGSLRRGRNGRSYCGYGVVLVDLNNLEYTDFGCEVTADSIVYVEAWAIYRAVEELIKLVGDDKAQVLVVTDNLLNVSIMVDYIPYIWDTSDWEHWKKVDGTPVKNQMLYRQYVEMLRRHPNVTVRYTHINSHLDMRKQWQRCQKKLNEYGVHTNQQAVRLFMEMNARADEIATTHSFAAKKYEEEHGEFMRLIRRKEVYDGN